MKTYAQRAAKRRAWAALTPHHRFLLMSERPDDLERDAGMRASVMTALENVFGPRVWSATCARVDEGDADEGHRRDVRRPKAPEYAMTLDEIGEDLGLCRERVREIIESALKKLRHPSRSRVLHEFMYGEPLRYIAGPEAIDESLDRARAASR